MRLILCLCFAGVGLSACSGDRSSRSGSPAMVGEPREVEVTSEPWTFEGRTGQLIKTGSFRIFTTMASGSTLERFPFFMETALSRYTHSITPLPRPSAPMETYFMARREQWEVLTQRLMGPQAPTYLRMPRGGFTSGGRAVLYHLGRPRDTFMIASHEGWHQFTQSTFREGLPMWLEEGLATYMEGFRIDQADTQRVEFLPWANTERFHALRAAVQANRLIPLEQILTSTPQELMARNSDEALQYYAQVWAFTHFLFDAENGKYRSTLEAIVRDAAEGRLSSHIRAKFGGRAASLFATRRLGAEPLLAYTDEELRIITSSYQRFVSSLVKLGNEQRIVQGQRPEFE